MILERHGEKMFQQDGGSLWRGNRSRKNAGQIFSSVTWIHYFNFSFLLIITVYNYITGFMLYFLQENDHDLQNMQKYQGDTRQGWCHCSYSICALSHSLHCDMMFFLRFDILCSLVPRRRWADVVPCRYRWLTLSCRLPHLDDCFKAKICGDLDSATMHSRRLQAGCTSTVKMQDKDQEIQQSSWKGKYVFVLLECFKCY